MIPYVIDVTKQHPGREYQKISLTPAANKFIFLYIIGFDFRKGYDLLIEAFCEEFSLYKNVSLVLKVYIHNGEPPNVVKQEIERHIPLKRHGN